MDAKAGKGYYGSLSADQEKALKEFRASIPDLPERYTDLMLLRFLRARAFNVGAAVEMLTKDIEWRKKVGADTILETFPKSKYFKGISEYWPGHPHKVDNRGIPVFYERLGIVDPKSLLKAIPQDDLLQFHIYMMERAEKRMRDAREQGITPELIDEGTVIIEDLQGLGMKHMLTQGLDMIQKLAEIDQNHYPESLKKMYLVNAPSIFSVIWKIIAPWLDPITAAKMAIVSTDYKPLLEAECGITNENLPSFLGGKCQCEGGCCPKGGVYGDVTSESSTVVNINSRDKHELIVKVEEEGSVLGWHFKPEGYDIGFIVYKQDNGKRKEVVPYAKFEDPAQGHVTASVGTYVLQFDNSYSMLRSKSVRYEIFVEPPRKEEEVKST